MMTMCEQTPFTRLSLACKRFRRPFSESIETPDIDNVEKCKREMAKDLMRKSIEDQQKMNAQGTRKSKHGRIESKEEKRQERNWKKRTELATSRSRTTSK